MKKKPKAPITKYSPHPRLGAWLKQIAARVEAIRERSDLKAPDFAKKVRVSPSTLSIMANGNRPYQIDGLLNVLAVEHDAPFEQILKMNFPTTDPRHIELHRRLQELLDADRDWQMAASINVDAVYGLFCARTKKS